MRYFTGSQWSSFKSGVTWSRFDFFKISRAALFWIFCMRAIYIYIYICMPQSYRKRFSFQPVLHGDRATQSHSFHPLTIHSSIHLQTHSHSTDHSLIPQARAIIQYNTTLLPGFSTLTARGMFCGAKYIHHTFIPIIKH